MNLHAKRTTPEAGCTCRYCVARRPAYNLLQQERAKRRSERQPPCGTAAAYKRGCRCEPCRGAKRDEQAERRARPCRACGVNPRATQLAVCESCAANRVTHQAALAAMDASMTRCDRCGSPLLPREQVPGGHACHVLGASHYASSRRAVW